MGVMGGWPDGMSVVSCPLCEAAGEGSSRVLANPEQLYCLLNYSCPSGGEDLRVRRRLMCVVGDSFLVKKSLVSATFRTERSRPCSGSRSWAISSWRPMRPIEREAKYLTAPTL